MYERVLKYRLGLLLIAVSVFCQYSCNKKTPDNSDEIKVENAVITVVDPSGISVPGITMELQKESDNKFEVIAVGTTNSSGEYTFKDLLPGKYNVIPHGRLVLSHPHEFTIKKGESPDLTIHLKLFSGQFRVLSYNIHEGLSDNQNLKKVFVDWVKKKNPDLIFYQELTSFTPEELSAMAAEYGQPYSVMYKTDNYPVGISSKYPILNVQKLKVAGSVHGCVFAQVLGMYVFAVHLSPGSLDKRIEEMNALSAKAKLLPKNSFVIFAGDFNSFSEFNARTYGPDWSSDMHKVKPNVKQDFTVTNTLLDMGYKDSYPIFHSDFKRSAPTTAYYTIDNRPEWFKGVRYDYVFLSPDLAKYCTAADVIQDDTTDYLSDHYPNIVDFKF